MWVGKWIAASLLTKQNIIKDAINQVIYRSGTSAVVEGREFSWEGVSTSNFNWIFHENAMMFKMACAVIVIAIVILLIRREAIIELNKAFFITMIFFLFHT